MSRRIVVFILAVFTSYAMASVGTVEKYKGKSYLIRGSQKIKIIKNLKLEQKDIVRTGKNAWVRLRFKDNTVINAGANAKLVIEEYLPNAGKKSKASFGFFKGIFRAATGAIGKKARKNFKVHTPNATIGIRGTEFYVNTNRRRNQIICSRGAIVVSNSFGEVVVEAGRMLELGKSGELGRAIRTSTRKVPPLKKKIGLLEKSFNKKKKKQPVKKPTSRDTKKRHIPARDVSDRAERVHEDAVTRDNNVIVDNPVPKTPDNKPCQVPVP